MRDPALGSNFVLRSFPLLEINIQCATLGIGIYFLLQLNKYAFPSYHFQRLNTIQGES